MCFGGAGILFRCLVISLRFRGGSTHDFRGSFNFLQMKFSSFGNRRVVSNDCGLEILNQTVESATPKNVSHAADNLSTAGDAPESLQGVMSTLPLKRSGYSDYEAIPGPAEGDGEPSMRTGNASSPSSPKSWDRSPTPPLSHEDRQDSGSRPERLQEEYDEDRIDPRDNSMFVKAPFLSESAAHPIATLAISPISAV